MRTFFKCEHGAVMMEFVIVFPIYLVLFGAIFAVGDMLVHVNRLPSAERTTAFGVDDASRNAALDFVRNTLFHNRKTRFGERELADSRDENGAPENQDLIENPEELAHYADTTVQGPWSVLAGTKVTDRYWLPIGGTAGRLAFSSWFSQDRAGGRSADQSFLDLITGVRRLELHSKDESASRTYAYNYYTLRRRRYADGGRLTWRDNGRPASDLLCALGGRSQHWRDVAEESWHAEGDFMRWNSNAAKPPAYKSPQPYEYKRYDQFRTWSN